jgi:L-fuconolactonase
MRIDAHQHFWRYEPEQYGWITDDMPVLKRDCLPADVLPHLRTHGISGCVAVQSVQSEAHTRFLLELADQFNEIRCVVGWVDLTADHLPDRLNYFSKFKKLRGFRHVVQAEPDDRFMLRPEFCRGMAHLGQFNFTYDILIYSRQLPAAIELVEKFPEQRFVIDHIAKPSIRNQELKPWSRHIREIATCRNVFCKLSGLVTEADWQHWRAEDFNLYLEVVLDAFGPERLMFGSDWPVCLLAADYAQVKSLVATHIDSLPPRQQEEIFGLSAVNFYGLENLPDGSEHTAGHNRFLVQVKSK